MADQDQTSQTLSKFCPQCQKRYTGDMVACPDDCSKLETRADLVGTTLAKKYEIIGKLGEGGMAIVYKAKHKVMQREVAIKMLKKHLISDVSAYQRFEQESQAASSLSHPNIVTVFDFGNEDDHAYFVMDCVEGQTLSQRLEKKHWIAEEEALDIFAQLCEGLTHAHRKGVVHRDLKPSNVVLTPQDDGKVLVKIVDFGIAKLMPSAGKHVQQLTQAGEVFGSPLYMSPEQCLGKSPDPRSDLYSLGCLMYQTLTGACPLVGETPFETMNMHVNTMPASFKQANEDVQVSAETEAVVFKCLQKDPAHRYQSAAAILADLPLAGRVPLAITSRNQAVKKFHFDRSAIILAGLVTVLTVFTGYIFFFWQGSVTDRGTPYDKLFWNSSMGAAEFCLKCNQYSASLWCFERAKTHASKIQDQRVKYMASLSEEKAAYAGLGDPDGKIDAIDKELSGLVRQNVQDRTADLMRILNLAKESKSSFDDRMKVALTKFPDVKVTAAQLYALGFYKEEMKLLQLALSDNVYRKGLAKDDTHIAELDAQLGKCYQAQSDMDNAEKSYHEAKQIYETVNHGSADAINALLILGIFEKESSNWEKATKYLGQALQEGREYRGKDGGDLYEQSAAAYKDLIKQLKGTGSKLRPEAEKFFAANK